MNYCFNCKKKFGTEDELCSKCGVRLCEMPRDAGDEMNEKQCTMPVSGFRETWK